MEAVQNNQGQSNQVQASPGKKVKPFLVVGIIVILLLVLAGAWWFFLRGEASTPQPSSSTPKTATSSATPSASAKPAEKSQASQDDDKSTKKGYSVKVYFPKHPESDDDPTKVFPVNRTAPDLEVAKYSLDQIIAGPTSAEEAEGYFNEVTLSGKSNCNGEDFIITISSGKANVRFCRNLMLAGLLSDPRAQTQIETTLLQFSTINKVVLLNKDGYCLFDTSGVDECDV